MPRRPKSHGRLAMTVSFWWCFSVPGCKLETVDVKANPRWPAFEPTPPRCSRHPSPEGNFSGAELHKLARGHILFLTSPFCCSAAEGLLTLRVLHGQSRTRACSYNCALLPKLQQNSLPGVYAERKKGFHRRAVEPRWSHCFTQQSGGRR